MYIKIAFIVIFFAVMIFVGIKSGKGSSDVDGFVLGGRKVGPWLTALSFGTSYFSAVIFIGYAGRFGWDFGLASTWIGLGNAFVGSLLAWVVLGRRTRVMTQHIGSKTMPDFFGIRFGSRGLTTVASIIVFIFLIPYTASLYNGLSQLFSTAFGAVPYAFWVIIMAVLTGVYVVFGGYVGSAVNNLIQGVVMLVGIVAVVIAVLAGNGGFTESIVSLSIEPFKNPDGSLFYGAFTSFFGPHPLQLLGVVVLTSLGTWGLPQMVNKFYSIKDEEAIKKGTVISTVFALIVAGGCYFLGGFGRLYADKISYNGAAPRFDTIIPSMLEAVCGNMGIWGDLLLGIVLVLVLAASMSTLSSLVLTSSSTITLDLIAPAVKKGLSEKKKMLIMRLFIVFFIIVSAVIAIVQAKSPNTYISDLMGISWGALAGAFLAPFLYGLFWKRTTKAAVVASFISGVGIMTVQFVLHTVIGLRFENAFFGYFLNSSINAGMLAMLVGLIIVPLVSLISKKPDKEKVDEIFSCYDKKVISNVKDSLGE